ncbi:hypothetical protein [Halobellus salinus]|uniref:hypothetical protein n=1 Tax=Halobellus salinus TaxID=931585 RepID=UPI00166B780D|nr:hypothetical protein [Halobellus salinus]
MSRVGVVIVAAVVALSAFAGPAAAATQTVELDEALNDQQRATEFTFTFTASGNDTVTADSGPSFQGGNVNFEFEGWDDLDSGASGSSPSWDVQNGNEYEVTYQAQVSSGANDESWTATVSGGSTSASETLNLNVDYLQPRFGATDSPTETLIFTDTNDASTELDIGFDNDGPGVMVLDSVNLDSTPSGIDVSVASLSNQVDGGGSGTAVLDVSVDPSVSAGDYTISGTITDSLGNTESFNAEIEVRKPPVISADDVDVGGVLIGESNTVDVTIEEVAGFSGVDGVKVNVIGTSDDGAVTVEGAGFASTGPGGSDTIEVQVSADSDGVQNADLDWQVELTPQDQYSPTESIDVTGEVFYPPNLESLSGEGAENVFDTPRSQADTQTTETRVTFENTGDLDMDVTGVSASVDDPDVSASIANADAAVGGQSTGEATVVLEADPEAAEGSYPFTVTVDTATAGTQSVTRDLTIEHIPELAVERSELPLGDITVTNQRTTSIDVSEVLEYESVSGVEVVRVSGPDQYLEVAERPTELRAGGSAPLVFAVAFDTSAELYQQYRWEFEVRGEGVETQTVTVTAQPTPYSFDSISNNLSSYAGGSGARAATAAGMAESLSALETRLRDGEEVPEGDLTETIAAGETAILLLDSLEAADEARGSDGPAAAQPDVLRAQATLNAMSEYVTRIDASQVDASATGSLESARAATDEQADAQVEYYESQLNGDITTLQRASANRQLARLAESRGNAERASRLNEEASGAFDTYLQQVQNASESAENARATRESIREDATLVLLNQPLVLNPARLDGISAEISAIDAAYATAEETYAEAGATGQADAIGGERATVQQRLQLTRYGLWGATALYGLVVLVALLRTGRNLYAYLQDRRTVEMGAVLQ